MTSRPLTVHVLVDDKFSSVPVTCRVPSPRHLLSTRTANWDILRPEKRKQLAGKVESQGWRKAEYSGGSSRGSWSSRQECSARYLTQISILNGPVHLMVLQGVFCERA